VVPPLSTTATLFPGAGFGGGWGVSGPSTATFAPAPSSAATGASTHTHMALTAAASPTTLGAGLVTPTGLGLDGLPPGALDTSWLDAFQDNGGDLMGPWGEDMDAGLGAATVAAPTPGPPPLG
jgi:hypothetical protein